MPNFRAYSKDAMGPRRLFSHTFSCQFHGFCILLYFYIGRNIVADATTCAQPWEVRQFGVAMFAVARRPGVEMELSILALAGGAGHSQLMALLL